MKRQILTVAAIFIFAAGSVSAQDESAKKDDRNSFFVAGNCGMCETRIEKAAKKVEGIATADWDKDTKILKLTYSNDKTDVKEVHKAVAAVGHDTKLVKSNDEVYANLPACCKYERLKKKN